MNLTARRKTLVLVLIVLAAAAIIASIGWSSAPSSAPATSSSTATQQTTSTSPLGGVSIATTSIETTPTLAATSSAWQPVANKNLGATVSIPPGWAIGSSAPLSFNNFNDAYLQGSVIPKGGAEIDVATTTLHGSLDTLVAQQLGGATMISTSSIAVNGAMCSEYNYQNTFSPTVASKNNAVYCSHAGTLFEIYLSYRADDPNGTQYVATFGQFLNRVQFGN